MNKCLHWLVSHLEPPAIVQPAARPIERLRRSQRAALGRAQKGLRGANGQRKLLCLKCIVVPHWSRRQNGQPSSYRRHLAAGASSEADLPPAAGAGAAVLSSRRRDCHYHDTPCLSLLKHLIKLQGGVIK